MIPISETTLYVPALRLKAGEIIGVSNLRDDVKACTRPHFIVPPRPERDSAIADLFSGVESLPDAGRVISKFWVGRTALINPKFLYQDFGEVSCATWLPTIFDSARDANVHAVPVATLNDLHSPRFSGIVGSIDPTAALKIALVIEQKDLVDPELRSKILSTIDRLGIDPKACAILIDFTGVSFEKPELVSGVIEAAYEDIQAIGNWESIIFQGTSFPVKNPATHKSIVSVPRNEWIAWRAAVNFSASTPNQFIFGDYAADNAMMRFGKCQVQAIRHYRYSTLEKWLIARAAEFGRDVERMSWVASQIVDSGEFASRIFSAADDTIYRTAKEGAGPGTAKDWRALNTTHHITRVVHDVGKVKGMTFEDARTPTPSKQYELL